MEEALPKEAPLLRFDVEVEEDEEVVFWVVDEVTMAVLVGMETMAPFPSKVKVWS